MKRPRHQARIAAMQGLYQLDIQRAPEDVDVAASLAPVLAEAEYPEEARAYAGRLVAGVWARREHYDAMIASASEHWDVARMGVVDRNILRLALFEMTERPEVPVRVVIDEAIEIGREFGDAETSSFINGVLDALWKNHPACHVARGETDEPATPPGERAEETDGTV